jgi:hypothetical protein
VQFPGAVARLLCVLALALAAGWMLGGDNLAAAFQQADDSGAVAIHLVAARTGVPPTRLVVVASAEARYPALGTVGRAYKVLDTATGVVESIVLDRQGEPLDPGFLASSDRALASANGSPLELTLASRLADVSPDQPLPVVFWLREPALPRPARVAPARPGASPIAQDVARAAEATTAASRAAVVRRLAAPLMSRLQAAGVATLDAGAAPAVFATVPASLLAELSSRPEIERVYLSGTNRPDLDVARPTIHADVVQARGLTGQGVQVAQIEPIGRVSAANPYLAGVTQDGVSACSTESDHATAVAGVLRSTDPALRGIAPGISLRVGGSCAGLSAELNNRAAAPADWGARVFSLSYSNDTGRVPNADDRFYDDLVFNSHRTVVKSAGNNGLTDGNVTSPGLGYNVLTVGNFDDHNTVAWADDSVNPTSSYLGPVSTHGDRRKPEIAAPGTNIRSLSLTAPWDTYSSTGASFATPMVAGTVALLLQRNADLAQWPEAVRAILLATAVNPLSGDPTLASRAGAGGLVADRADDLVQRTNGDWGAQGYDCSSPALLDVATLSLTAGQRVRAVLAWNTDPSWSGWPTLPGTDLDLVTLGPGGSSVAVSASLDNSWELVEFTAATSGDYRLRVSRSRCDSSPNGLAWAWHVVSAPAASPTPTGTPTQLPPTATATRTLSPTATPTRAPPTVTATPTPLPNCSPTRPHVGVSVTPGGGRLLVSVGTETLPGGSANAITALRFGAATNALIDVGTLVGRTGNLSVPLAPSTTTTSFVVRQANTSQPTTVPLTVVDGCGEWPTVVGGGPAAFTSQAAVAAAGCSPRPAIAVTASPVSAGRLMVTVRSEAGAGADALLSVHFGLASNALIDAGDRVGSTGDFALALEPSASEATFAVRRAAAGRATTVPLTVTDSCGDWPTVVGGGPEAF